MHVADTVKLLDLHTLTKSAAQGAQRILKVQVDALAPLFRPRRLLGDVIDGFGNEAVSNTERNWADLQDLYRRAAINPFDLRPELRAPVESIGTQFHFSEWQYIHSIHTSDGWEAIRVNTPLTWILSYASPYSLSNLRDVVSGSAQRDNEAVRSFVLRACVMHEMFRKYPAITELLAALRYKVEVKTSPQLGELPLVTISAPIRTFRPADELVAMASGLAGGNTFSEVLDLESVRTLSDPVRDDIMGLLQKHKIEL